MRYTFILFGILIFASFCAWFVEKLRPQKNLSELKFRIQSWWVILSFICIAISSSRPVSMTLLAFISFLAFKEYLSLIQTRRADRRILFWAYLSIPMQFYWIWLEWYGMFVIFIPVYVLLFLPTQMVVIGETKGFLNAIGSIHWGLMMTVFSIGHLAYLLVLPSNKNPMGGSPAMVIFLVAITQINDISHYFMDSIIGKNRILPSLRPDKTMEGFLAATALTILASWIFAPHLTPLNSLESLSIGLILALGGFIGDMVISAVKKDLHVTETYKEDNRKGNQLLSHRGVMNRIDSLTYTAPLFFHFVYYFKY